MTYWRLISHKHELVALIEPPTTQEECISCIKVIMQTIKHPVVLVDVMNKPIAWINFMHSN